MTKAAVQLTADVRNAVAAIRDFVADCEARKRTLGDVPDEELAELVEQIRAGVHVSVRGPVHLYGTPSGEFVKSFARAMTESARKERRAL